MIPGAVLVENSPYAQNIPDKDGHGLDPCCAYMEELIQLSVGYYVGNSWLELWQIPQYLETRKEINEHEC